jgi:hypothetical protein
MKKRCPHCFTENVTAIWKNGRKLQDHCYTCGNFGKPYEPTKKELKTSKILSFPYEYEVYDRYNYVLKFSKGFSNINEVKNAAKKDIEIGKKDINAGPYTILIWPSEIIIHAEIIS